MALVLRPPEQRDEAECLAAHGEFESFPFLLLWNPTLTWSAYLELLDGKVDPTAGTVVDL